MTCATVPPDRSPAKPLEFRAVLRTSEAGLFLCAHRQMQNSNSPKPPSVRDRGKSGKLKSRASV